MKVLAVVGSPRKRGNTDLLIDVAIRGAQDAGARVEKVFLAALEIAPCDGCDACRKAFRCVHQDDMIPLYDKLFESEAWLLGTPVYWWGPSAQLKAFVDRWYLFGDEGRHRVQGKRAGLVIPFGDADPAVARHVVGMFQDAFEYLRIDLAGPVLVSANDRGEAARNQAALDQAYALGQQLVRRA